MTKLENAIGVFNIWVADLRIYKGSADYEQFILCRDAVIKAATDQECERWKRGIAAISAAFREEARIEQESCRGREIDPADDGRI